MVQLSPPALYDLPDRRRQRPPIAARGGWQYAKNPRSVTVSASGEPSKSCFKANRRKTVPGRQPIRKVARKSDNVCRTGGDCPPNATSLSVLERRSCAGIDACHHRAGGGESATVTSPLPNPGDATSMQWLIPFRHGKALVYSWLVSSTRARACDRNRTARPRRRDALASISCRCNQSLAERLKRWFAVTSLTFGRMDAHRYPKDNRCGISLRQARLDVGFSAITAGIFATLFSKRGGFNNKDLVKRCQSERRAHRRKMIGCPERVAR